MGWSAFDATMVAVLALVGLRWAAFLVCAVIDAELHRRRRGALLRARESGPHPPVAVLVPAYNEAQVIAGTVRRILASRYPDLQVFVIDDGSADDTAGVVGAIATEDPRVHLVQQPSNQGKAAALVAGAAATDRDVWVTVDADTWLDEDAIGWLVASMVTRQAVAVASNVRVGNPRNLWTRWQSLEYVTGLNIDRRAQEVLGVIHTVPGAASLWVRSAVEAAGGFDGRTLAEDTDMTVHLLRRGARVVFAPQAIAWTEAPEGLAALFRQRLRWLHGNLQCAAYHSEAWWRPSPWRVRLIALPNLWFSHFGVYLLLPLTIAYAFAAHGTEPLAVLGWLFATLFALDVAAALTAYALDRADPWDLVWAPSQRVGYPLLLWVVFAVVMFRVARRVPTPWNKLPRRGLPEPDVGRRTLPGA